MAARFPFCFDPAYRRLARPFGVTPERAWVELSIADNGPGLPEGFDERWFEPYTTSKVRGTGLGLAVAKKIAEEHGGSIRAENRPLGGAVFIVRLPRDAEAVRA